MKHISAAIAGDLDKLPAAKRARIRDVANANTASTSVRGANRPAGRVDMARKIGPHTGGRPPAEMPQSSGKPVADWPVNRATFSSGVAKRGSIGTMPS